MAMHSRQQEEEDEGNAVSDAVSDPDVISSPVRTSGEAPSDLRQGVGGRQLIAKRRRTDDNGQWVYSASEDRTTTPTGSNSPGMDFQSASFGNHQTHSPSGSFLPPFDPYDASIVFPSDSPVASVSQSLRSQGHYDPIPNSFFPGLVKQPMISDIRGGQTRLQAILLRYFIEELAHWFDLCDPERHFAQVVPQRARFSIPLLNAILTASARHLANSPKHRNVSGSVEWQGNVLPEVQEELAVNYHNDCIRELLQLSTDPEQLHNELLLAAAIILRSDEEMDAPHHGEEEDKQIFLRVANLFISAQVPAAVSLPHSSPQIYHPQEFAGDSARAMPEQSRTAASPAIMSSGESISHSSPTTSSQPMLPTDPTPRVTRADGLRQACFWVAFRQELYASFIKQRPISFPLSRCDAFRNFSPAEDAVWADRMVIFCGDVVEYCYGSDGSGEVGQTPETADDGWYRLKQHDHTLSSLLPSSFEPTYFRDPDSEREEVFPEIWYLDACHVTGTAHVELARILLAVFNPTNPKLGRGHMASIRETTTLVKKIVLRLCGIALSNRRSAPSFITAYMGIAMCGERFENRKEQEALIDILNLMEREYAYPTSKVMDGLRKAWEWD